MEQSLLKARFISFVYSLGSLIGLAIAGVLLSPEFAALVNEYFGTGVSASLILLFGTEVAKHLRNLSVIKKAKLGAQRGDRVDYTLI